MLNEFITYLEGKVGKSIYVWGGQGESHNTITEAWIKKMETSTTNANRVIAFWKKQIAAGHQKTLMAFDCSGLGMYFLQNLHKMAPYDMNSATMRGNCTAITKAQLKRGDWVFRVNASGTYHVGYVVDDSLNVIESKGRDEGVVKKGLNANGSSYWTHFGRPKWFKDEIEKAIKPAPNPTPAPSSTSGVFTRLIKLTSPMMRGEDVRLLQTLLNKRGYPVGKEDGIFGANTKKAVIALQKATGLAQDGIVGKNTASKLSVTWRG